MNEPTQSKLAAIAHADQTTAEMHRTAARVGAYYRVLVANGIAETMATRMTAVYNVLMLARYFEVPVDGMDGGAMDWEGDE